MRMVQFSVELSAFWTPLRSNERRFLKLLKQITSKLRLLLSLLEAVTILPTRCSFAFFFVIYG